MHQGTHVVDPENANVTYGKLIHAGIFTEQQQMYTGSSLSYCEGCTGVFGGWFGTEKSFSTFRPDAPLSRYGGEKTGQWGASFARLYVRVPRTFSAQITMKAPGQAKRSTATPRVTRPRADPGSTENRSVHRSPSSSASDFHTIQLPSSGLFLTNSSHIHPYRLETPQTLVLRAGSWNIRGSHECQQGFQRRTINEGLTIEILCLPYEQRTRETQQESCSWADATEEIKLAGPHDSLHVEAPMTDMLKPIGAIKTRKSTIGALDQEITAAQRSKLRMIKAKAHIIREVHQELSRVHEMRAPYTIEELESQRDIIGSEWAELNKINDQLIDSLPAEHEYHEGKEYDEASHYKRGCLTLMGQIRGQIIHVRDAARSQDATYAHQLGTLKIKPFDGKREEWREFSESFLTMVGNDESIPPVKKLMWLKTFLKGMPAELLTTFSTQPASYEKAWQKLVRRYEDPSTSATAESLGSRASTVVETLDQLKDVPGLDTENITEQFFAHILRRSLDVDTLKQWEVKLGTSKDFPSLQEFVDFLEAYGRALNAGASLKDHQESGPATKKIKSGYMTTQQPESHSTEKLLPKTNCAYCKGRHFIALCPLFKTLIPVKRNEFVVHKELCFRCLGPHRKPKCKSTKTCHECNRDHHTLIHNGSSWTTTPAVGTGLKSKDRNDEHPKPGTSTRLSTSSASSEISTPRINERSTEIHAVHQPEDDQQAVLLATARLRAHSPRGFMVKARALIDQGSELSFITDQLAHQLQLKRRPSSTELVGIGGINSGITKGVVTVILQSTQGQRHITISAHVLKKLTTTLPSFSCTLADIGSLENLQLADPQYLRPGPIDIIIGADYYGRIIESQIIKSRRTAVVGQRTAFGWILSGPVKCTSCLTKISLSAVRESSNEQLLELLQKFWVQEELPIQHQQSELSIEELECEKHFQETHRRDESGRYIVRLPLRTSSAALGDSKNKASRQLKSVISRLNKDQAYAQLYEEFIREYEELGHMTRASKLPESSTAYYLPHHGVLRENAITTKLRVVFNGSSASSSGMSLNDILYPGVKLQINPMNVLTWMRRHKLVFGTDIVKMFRQIKVHQDDWDLQRILWIDDNQQEITFQLTTVTYGLNCSPWLSLRVLQQLADDEGHRFPVAVEAITRGRYVDDIYGGSDSEEGLKEIAVQLQGLCKAGGFDLQKWSSNCPEALHQLGLTTESSLIQFEESVTKVLGLCWHQSTDTFRYKSRRFNAATITKRTVSSEIAQIFDPLGFIAPVVVQGKVLLQELWKLKANWDDPLPEEYKERWRTFRGDLTNLDRVTVPRWIQLTSKTTNIQIHGFADASTVAMSAVVYLRTRSSNENPSTTLVCAKTKVAPIKRMTIPRLELTAALLLTQLVDSIYEMLQLDRNQMETYLWSDSSATLAWIRSPASRWKDFVHNRVIKIQETLLKAIWRHVSGKENPADCASRGISPNELVDHPLWWSAPSWINQDPDNWPQSTIDVSKMDTPEVAKEAKPVPAHPARMKISKVAELLNRYSKMAKLLAVTATINRAIDRFSRRPTPPGPVLTTRELNEARTFWTFAERSSVTKKPLASQANTNAR
ncbi:uncharacterized protein LOC135166760 [Diachasmimorpha longicaudata]|uniref:uncharacterized protein LOC135166760 n=1 Tax=Diachasmimorpha longicaudata TaxID=58733 RepID=UPI0030B8DE92